MATQTDVRHTDLINLPHYYTHKLYKGIVTKGNMK